METGARCQGVIPTVSALLVFRTSLYVQLVGHNVFAVLSRVEV